jgi:hypothetical protein
MTLQGNPQVANLFPRVTNLLGYHVNHQGEIRQKISFPSKCSIIKKGIFATWLNASNIKVTLTMRLDLLPHEARHVVFWELGRCSGHYSVVNDDGGELW